MPKIEKHLKILYAIGFFFSMQYALTAYINSTFLSGYFNSEIVGLLFILSALLDLFALWQFEKILTKIGNYKTTIIIILISLGALLALVLSKSPYFIIPAFILYLSANALLVFPRDIFIENYSKVETTGETRGGFLTFMNLAFVLSPLLAGFVINKYSYPGIYLLAFIAIIPPLFLLVNNFRKFKDPKYIKISLREIRRDLFTNKDIKRVYYINFLLQFFYACMVIYTPIYLRSEIGLTWDKIGIIFTIMLLPFILLEYPLGKLSDKIGEKKLFWVGFCFITFFTFLFAFIPKDASLLKWAYVLFMTRAGAAIVEVMSESYFFKKVKTREASVISFFRNTPSLAYILAPLLAGITFLFLPLKFLFIILAIILLTGFYLTYRLKDTTHNYQNEIPN